MLSVKQVAGRLNVSVGTIYGLVNRGRLAAYRIGVGRGTLRIPEESIERFLESNIVDGRGIASPPPTTGATPFKHLDGDRLRAAWQKQGVRADRPDGRNARPSE